MKPARRVLIISDLHCPYQHPGAFRFLKDLKQDVKPDLVVNIGDETDGHALSFHQKDPDLDSAGTELEQAKAHIHELYSIFPKMVLVESNHGSRHYRKALDAGIPRAYLRNYNEVLGVGKGWQWVRDFTFLTSKGYVYACHGKAKHAINVSRNMGISVVQGHYHTEMSIRYWANPLGMQFAMQVGCLIDDEKLAFMYNKNEVDRPLLGCGLIIDGHPRLAPLV